MASLKRLSEMFLISSFLVTLNSCDPGSKIGYTVLNKTGKTIKIKYQFPGDSSIVATKIPSDSSKLIRKESKLGYTDDVNKRTDSIYFYPFFIEKESRISHVNLKDKKYWKFKKDTNHEATYLLTVDDSFFNK